MAEAWDLLRGATRMRLWPVAPRLLVHQISAAVGCPIATGLWLWLAWANGTGKDWARMLSGACFGVCTLTVLGLLAQHVAAVAPASVIAATVVWAIGLASVVLIFTPAATRYYRPALIPMTTRALQEATMLVLTALSRGSQHGRCRLWCACRFPA